MTSTPQPPTIEPGSLRTETQAGVTSVIFSHPRSNSLPGPLLAKIAAAVTAAGENPESRVVLLRSEGAGAFCAGASFDELKAISDAEAGRKFFMGFANLILAMIRCPKLVVTRVHGKAVGGGVGIIAASDYVIASANAAVRLSELAVGLGPFIIGPPIERKVGLAAYSTMAVDADWHDAEWAYRQGLYSELQPDESALDKAVEKRLESLASSNPEAMTRLKSIFWAGTEDWGELLESRAAISGALVLSDFTSRAIGRAS